MPTPQLPDPRDAWTPDDARRVLEEWRDRGESLAAFARRNRIAPARLYWWKKRLAASSRTAAPPLSLIPATVVSLESAAAVTLRLPSGIAVELASAHASPSVVAAIVAELTRTLS